VAELLLGLCGNSQMAGFGRMQVVPKQVLVLHRGTVSREHASTGAGVVAAPHRRCNISQPVGRRVGDRIVDELVSIDHMHVESGGTGDGGELAREISIVLVGELRGLLIESGRGRIAAVDQPLGKWPAPCQDPARRAQAGSSRPLQRAGLRS
jgi:hypothetical protein